MANDQKTKKKRKKREAELLAETHRHVLYSAAVQQPDADFDFVERIFRKERGRLPKLLREDFSGTSKISYDWVRRRRGNRAWAIDLDRPTLEWGRKHYLSKLNSAREKVELICDDVLHARTPLVDVTMALNFSYFIFKERDMLRRYFKSAHQHLRKDGVFFLDTFGGWGALNHCWEKRTISDGEDPEGKPLPKFKMIWEQERFNSVTNDILCHIHFGLGKGKMMKKAFTYDWRLWTVPELRELLEEAGFVRSEVYAHGWSGDGKSDHVYRKRKQIINEEGWLGYIVACK